MLLKDSRPGPRLEVLGRLHQAEVRLLSDRRVLCPLSHCSRQEYLFGARMLWRFT